MGICTSNYDKTIQHADLIPFRIASIYVDIDDTINKIHKINTIIDYFMKPYYGNYIDVLCIQGIHNYRVLKELLKAFRERVKTYNDGCKNTCNKTLYLEYYPDIKNLTETLNSTTCSTTDFDINNNYHNKLIISRYAILQSSNIFLDIQPEHKDDIKFIHNDIDTSIIDKYIQLVNLNVEGTYISIYNIDLKEDNIGINNTKERQTQIHKINKIINNNRMNASKPETRQFIYGDTTYIACDRNIHIITGMFNIDKYKNSLLSPEYTKLCSILNGIDINQLVSIIKNDNIQHHTNARFTKNTYTFLISDSNNTAQYDTEQFTKTLFADHKLVIINSIIATHIVDMNKFINYPEDTLFMLYKPKINKTLSIINNQHEHINIKQHTPIRKQKIKIRKNKIQLTANT
jgi:hypothetical protein